ncbi:MAG: mucoidy inhibitor MuiA family protein, partial [Bacteroidota bacterium]
MKFKLPLALVFALVGLIPIFAQSEKEITSKIEAVTVYRDRAQVSRSASIDAKAGDNVLVFSGLSQYILPNSINVRGQGSGIIQSVRHRVNYLNRTQVPEKVQKLRDQIEGLQAEQVQLSDERFINQSEEKLLLLNQKLSSEQTGVDVNALRELAQLYRERLTEVRRNLRAITLRERELNREISQLQAEINSLQSRVNVPTQEVVVVYQAERTHEADLELSYLVSGAGWNPFYDIRVANTADPLQLALKAKVVNNTGMDWEKVKIKLSTTKNSGNNDAPILNPAWLAISRSVTQSGRKREREMNRFSSEDLDGDGPSAADIRSNTMTGFQLNDKVAEEAGSAADYTTTNEGELGLEFDIALTYDIPADGKEHQVDILQSELQADYRHYAVPKLDRDAFLVAEIREDLLRGPANVYFEGTFVGETYVNTDNPRDSMRISLGRDPKVQIQRERVTTFQERKVVGGNIRQTYGFEITVKNNKS